MLSCGSACDRAGWPGPRHPYAIASGSRITAHDHETSAISLTELLRLRNDKSVVSWAVEPLARARVRPSDLSHAHRVLKSASARCSLFYLFPKLDLVLALRGHGSTLEHLSSGAHSCLRDSVLRRISGRRMCRRGSPRWICGGELPQFASLFTSTDLLCDRSLLLARQSFESRTDRKSVV